MEYISKILQIFSLITSSMTIAALFIKPIREKIFGIGEIREGNKCMLRSDMLKIYYAGKDHDDRIRQHEYENFVLMYKAYKAMKGNSFIDKIYEEVKKMEVVT